MYENSIPTMKIKNYYLYLQKNRLVDSIQYLYLLDLLVSGYYLGTTNYIDILNLQAFKI